MKKFSVVKKNNFICFKVRPLVLTAVVASSIAISGLFVGCSNEPINTQQNPTTNVNPATTDTQTPGKENETPSTDVKEVNTIKSISTYKLNLDDFDMAVTPSFTMDAEGGIHEIDDCDIVDNNYNFKLQDGTVISSNIDNAVLIDNDFKPREMPDENRLEPFQAALINYYDGLKSINLNNLTVEKIDGKYFYLCDTADVTNVGENLLTEDEVKVTKGVRLLQSIDNVLPYRDLDAETAISKYGNESNFPTAYIEANGSVFRLTNYLGAFEVNINGADFILVCGEHGKHGYREFLTTKEHLLLLRKKTNMEEPIKGTRLNYEGAFGNMSMFYTSNTNLYLKINSLIMGEDNFYHFTTGYTNDEMVVRAPINGFSFEFQEKTELAPEGTEKIALNDYSKMIYDENSFASPISNKGVELAKIDDNYLYLVTEPYTKKIEKYVSKPAAGVYGAHSMILARFIEDEEFKNNYTLAKEPLDFAFNMGGYTFSDDPESYGKGGQYLAYKEVNILGLDYYTIVYQCVNTTKNEITNIELLVPKTCVVIKGQEQDLAIQKVLR